MSSSPPPALPDSALHLVSGTVCAIDRGAGAGPHPGPGDGVTVRYRAWTADGRLMADVAEPVSQSVSDFAPGPAEVLQLMSAGDSAVVHAPPPTPGDPTVFEIHLVAVDVRTPPREIPPDLRSPRLE
jgi:FKBP-type peptidyl-prolyl cis-trans isomerase